MNSVLKALNSLNRKQLENVFNNELEIVCNGLRFVFFLINDYCDDDNAIFCEVFDKRGKKLSSYEYFFTNFISRDQTILNFLKSYSEALSEQIKAKEV